MIIGKSKLSEINTDAKRLEGKFYLNDNAVNVRTLKNSNLDKIELGKIAEVFNTPIFKRQFCEKSEEAVPYRKSHDIIKNYEEPFSFLSKSQVLKYSLAVEKGWILITGFGTEIGNVGLVDDLFHGDAFANNVCRVRLHSEDYQGYILAFLKSKFGKSQFNNNASGSAIRYLEAPGIKKTLIPQIPEAEQSKAHVLSIKSSELRVRAHKLLRKVQKDLKESTDLVPLTNLDYDFFGNNSYGRPVSVFKRNIDAISPLSINAFNYSKRIERLENRVKNGDYLSLLDCLDEDKFFSSGSFKRLELDSPNSVRLLNQSDIFHIRKQGKLLANLFVKPDKLVEYGEVLIAGVGTLGEGETFCRAIFANEELEGQLISGEFIRMKTNGKVPSGYLYAWLSSDYGFRLIRKTQSGTKLCRPIQELLKSIPVPIIEKEEMLKIDEQVKKAHTMLFEALNAENKAIEIVENEIESWQKS